MSIHPTPAAVKSPPAEWVPLLEQATREVFDLMVGQKVESATKPSAINFEVTAMVGLAGEICGVLTFCCSQQGANAMASKMLSMQIDEPEDQVWDAIGEITNMIAGNFKNKISGLSERCVLSVPTVISGSSYRCHSMADSGSIEVRFTFQRLPIEITLEIHT